MMFLPMHVSAFLETPMGCNWEFSLSRKWLSAGLPQCHSAAREWGSGLPDECDRERAGTGFRVWLHCEQSLAKFVQVQARWPPSLCQIPINLLNCWLRYFHKKALFVFSRPHQGLKRSENIRERRLLLVRKMLHQKGYVHGNDACKYPPCKLFFVPAQKEVAHVVVKVQQGAG